MITYDDALTAREFWHMTERNADGTPTRCRKTGATKTWKTRPGMFRVPVKYGLRTSFYIDNGTNTTSSNNAKDWCTPEKWPAEHVLFEGLVTTVPTLPMTRARQLELARKAFKQDPTPALAATLRALEGRP